MKPKYCSNCKTETMHYKDMCIKCGKLQKKINNPLEQLLGDK